MRQTHFQATSLVDMLYTLEALDRAASTPVVASIQNPDPYGQNNPFLQTLKQPAEATQASGTPDAPNAPGESGLLSNPYVEAKPVSRLDITVGAVASQAQARPGALDPNPMSAGAANPVNPASSVNHPTVLHRPNL